MAIEKVIEIKVKDKQAVKGFSNIEDSIDRTKKSVIELEAQLLKLDRAEKRLHRNDAKRRKTINDLRGKTNQSLAIQKNRLKSLSLQKQIANKATRSQIKSNKGLNKEYFKSKESLTDVNRLTAEFALKVKAVRNIFVGAIQKVKEFAKAQKLAFSATIIGVALIALLLIIQYWTEIKDLVQGVTKELKLQIKLNELLADRSNARLNILKEEEKLLKKKGLSTKDNLVDQRKEIVLQNDLNAKNLIGLKVLFEKNLQSSIQLSWLDRILGRAAQITEKELEGLAATRKRIEELGVSVATGKNTLFDFDNPTVSGDGAVETRGGREIVEGVGFDKLRIGDRHIVESKIQMEDELANVDIDARTAEKVRQAKAFLDKQHQDNLGIAWAKELKDDSLEIARLEAEGKVELAFLVSDAVASVGDLLGKETTAGKALSIAATLISTWQSAQLAYQSQLTLPTPDAPLRAALAYGVALTQGLATVKQIISVKTPGGGSVGVGGGAGQQTSPSFNVVGTSGTNQLAQSLANQDQPIQAFVVGSNVTTQQALDRNIIETATIG